MKISKSNMQKIIFGELPGYEIQRFLTVYQLMDWNNGIVGGHVLKECIFRYQNQDYSILIVEMDGYTPSLRLYPHDYVVATPKNNI